MAKRLETTSPEYAEFLELYNERYQKCGPSWSPEVHRGDVWKYKDNCGCWRCGLEELREWEKQRGKYMACKICGKEVQKIHMSWVLLDSGETVGPFCGGCFNERIHDKERTR